MPRFTREGVSGEVSEDVAATLGPDYVIEDAKAPAKKTAAKKSSK